MIVGAYADGGVIQRNPSTIGGTWAWVHVSDADEIIQSASGLVLPGTKYPLISNNYTEFVAAVRCLQALPSGWSGTFYSDSEITIGRIFWSWACEGLPRVLVQKSRVALEQLGMVIPIRLDGHPTKAQLAAGVSEKGRPVSPYNVLCDQMCRDVSIEYVKTVVASTGRLPSLTVASALPSKVTELGDVY